MNVYCFSQGHIEIGFIGSSDTEGTTLETADEGQIMEEVQSSSLAMWETEVQHIELEKGSMGLGFSILDYQVTSALLYMEEKILRIVWILQCVLYISIISLIETK